MKYRIEEHKTEKVNYFYPQYHHWFWGWCYFWDEELRVQFYSLSEAIRFINKGAKVEPKYKVIIHEV